MTAKDILKINTAWDDFQASYEGLSPAQLVIPDVVGHWSVRDILAHVTTWERESIERLAMVRRGEPVPSYEERYRDVDLFNARMTEAKRGLSLVEVQGQLAATHAELWAALEAFPDKEQAAGLVQADTWTHYPEHAASIRAWRNKLGL